MADLSKWLTDVGYRVMNMSEDGIMHYLTDAEFLEVKQLADKLTRLFEPLRGHIFERECQRINDLTPIQRAAEYGTKEAKIQNKLTHKILRELNYDTDKIARLVSLLSSAKKQ